MDIKNLKTFIQVAELRSFTRAAAKLGCTQSTVSFQIKQLENEIGQPLFDRINHTIVLTEKGKHLFRSAQQINILLDEVLNSHESDAIHGQVRLAMADSLCRLLIGNIFPVLRSRYPEISLNIIPADTEDMFRLLNQNQVDLVCTMDNHIYDSNYRILQECQIQTHLVCSSRSSLAGRTLQLQDLIHEPFLLTEKGMSYRKNLDEALAKSSLEIHPILETGDVSLICDLVIKDLGISFLPDYAVKPWIESGEMVCLQVEGLRTDEWTQLLCHRDKWISPPIQAVIDILGAGIISSFT